ncbi:MAG: N-acyl-D-amino-acid deacylase [Akkermansiaceae bacterium]|jgi:hypothetical protein
MKMKISVILRLSCFLIGGASLQADTSGSDPRVLKSAIERSILLLEKTTAGVSEHSRCFTCHGHAMPVVTFVEARRRGFFIDEKNMAAQVKHTLTDLARGKKRYLEGRGQGGGYTRAGYALWSLQQAGWKPNEVTGYVSGYLVHDQKAERWPSNENRPPTESSAFTTTYLALKGVDGFGTVEQAEKIAVRKEKALAWLLRSEPKETEDRVFHLLALNHLKADQKVMKEAVKTLREAQRKDGGWAQLPTMESDAYATGTVLYALYHGGGMKADDTIYQRGVKYLLETQKEDGSWHVRSRSKPFQTYYESGYPHKKDQFISMAAGSWASLALLFMIPVEEAEKE